MADDGCARQSVSMPPPMLAALKREAKKRDLTRFQGRLSREKIPVEAQRPSQRPGGNPGLIAGACQCQTKREAL